MSFDFDPNVKIDREVDNDPQDVESYVGGEGLYGRVPGGPQVGAANRSQGQPFGDQGLPIRLGQAQAHGGLGQARGGPVPRSAGQAPSIQGTLGRVPSHLSLAASAASASGSPQTDVSGLKSAKRLR